KAPRLPEADYRLRIRIITSQGRALGWQDVPIRLGTAGAPFVLLQTGPIILPDGTTAHPNEGPNVDAGASLKFQARGENRSETALTVIPHLELYQWDLTGKKLREQDFDPLSISSRQTANIELPVTAETTPDAYHAVLTLRDQQGNRISSQATYRVVVKGTSGKVVTARFKKLATMKGETAIVAADVVGPADRETTVNATAAVELLDGDASIAEQTVPVSLDLGVKIVEATFVLPRDTQHPGFRIILRDASGMILDQYTSHANLSPDELQTAAEAKPVAFRTSLVARVLLVIVVLCTLIALLVHILRNRSSSKGMLLLVLLAGGVTTLMLAPGREALSHHVPPERATGIGILVRHIGGSETSMFINAPQHGGTYGETVEYQYALSFIACGNGIIRSNQAIRSARQGGTYNTFEFTGRTDEAGNSFDRTCNPGQYCPVVENFRGSLSFPTANFFWPNTTIQIHTDRFWQGQFRYSEAWNVHVNFLPRAACVGVTAPDRVHRAQTFTTLVRMQNAGNVPWTSALPNPFRLGLSGPWLQMPARVELPNSPVNRGGIADFRFNAQAPVAPGQSTSQFQMLQENVRTFPDSCSKTITAVAPNAVCVGADVPATVNPNQTFTATVRMQNTGCPGGCAEWARDDPNYPFRLAVAPGAPWGPPGARANLQQPVVGPNGTATFTFQAQAPGTPGRHVTNFQMLQENLPGGQFGAVCQVALQVNQPPATPPPPPNRNAACVSIQAPDQVDPGQTFNAVVTMQNTGTARWEPSSDQLVSQNPMENTRWGPTTRWRLGGSVDPGGRAVFDLSNNVRAPGTPGRYAFDWGMLFASEEPYGLCQKFIQVGGQEPPAAPTCSLSAFPFT
ncbi:MAG: NBR1-Ig-like domain-containing protein, partial [bacterium]|nr:NBR1-Ig-like domain-containing protein [bacterium]